jgi:hypothetical protein
MPLGVGVFPNTDDIVPKLEAMLRSPTVIALKDGNDELFRAVKELCEGQVLSIHGKSYLVSVSTFPDNRRGSSRSRVWRRFWIWR